MSIVNRSIGAFKIFITSLCLLTGVPLRVARIQTNKKLIGQSVFIIIAFISRPVFVFSFKCCYIFGMDFTAVNAIVLKTLFDSISCKLMKKKKKRTTIFKRFILRKNAIGPNPPPVLPRRHCPCRTPPARHIHG